MLIHDLSYLETLERSSNIVGGLQPDNGVLTITIGEDNTLSVSQGSTALVNTKLVGPVQGLRVSVPGNPNVALSTATVTANGKSRTNLALNFNTSPGLSFTSAFAVGLATLS